MQYERQYILYKNLYNDIINKQIGGNGLNDIINLMRTNVSLDIISPELKKLVDIHRDMIYKEQQKQYINVDDIGDISEEKVDTLLDPTKADEKLNINDASLSELLDLYKKINNNAPTFIDYDFLTSVFLLSNNDNLARLRQTTLLTTLLCIDTMPVSRFFIRLTNIIDTFKAYDSTKWDSIIKLPCILMEAISWIVSNLISHLVYLEIVNLKTSYQCIGKYYYGMMKYPLTKRRFL